ncbi:MAG: hypothetical protein JXM71_08525 [Spirochaetales bacterium]|nr:hypothetical protein [Spirochaetales bacterium]
MDDLLRLLPPIRRIRGNRLYAADGRRFLDLWLDDGRGMLGERERATRVRAANASDKGLIRPYPGVYDARLAAAVAATWPGFTVVRLYTDETRAITAASRALGMVAGQAILVDTALRPGTLPQSAPTSDGSPVIALARAFITVPADVELAMPRLPCPRPWAPHCVMARAGSAAADALASDPGDIVPAMAPFASARALASLASAEREGYDETLWSRFDRRMGDYFERSGPYLFAKAEAIDYERFFRAALRGGALVSPVASAPSIVPPDFDDGELAKLAEALASGRGD